VLNSTFDLATANSKFGYSPDEVPTFSPINRERLGRLFYFGLEDEHNWLGWDLGDVRDSKDYEYTIYRVGLVDVTFAASSFRELVETVCERLFAPSEDWDEEELGPRRVFHPATIST
jgi:hypothetical protein